MKLAIASTLIASTAAFGINKADVSNETQVIVYVKHTTNDNNLIFLTKGCQGRWCHCFPYRFPCFRW